MSVLLDIAAAAHPLGIRDDVPVTREQLRRLAALEAFDLWFVEERLARKELLPLGLIPEAVAEFRRYIALIVLGHRGLGVPSPEVDEVWHALILFTQDYARFCDLLGAGFIHHVPHTSRSPARPLGEPSYKELHRKYFCGPAPKAADVAALCSDRWCKPPCDPDPYGCHDRVATAQSSGEIRSTCHTHCNPCGVA